MPRYWSVDEAWTAAESSPEFDRELRRSLGDEVAIDFPSMRGPITRMRAGFGDAVDEAPLVARVTLSARQAQAGTKVPLDVPLRAAVRSLRRPRRHLAGGLRAVRTAPATPPSAIPSRSPCRRASSTARGSPSPDASARPARPGRSARRGAVTRHVDFLAQLYRVWGAVFGIVGAAGLALAGGACGRRPHVRARSPPGRTWRPDSPPW